jgi:hypothetical protein
MREVIEELSCALTHGLSNDINCDRCLKAPGKCGERCLGKRPLTLFGLSLQIRFKEKEIL